MSMTIAKQYKVIDTDTHVLEPPDLWSARIPAKYADKMPYVKFDESMNEDAWFLNGKRTGPAAGGAMAGWHEYAPSRPKRLADVDPGIYEANARLKVMDASGIHAQILYPNSVLFGAGNFLSMGDPDAMLALVATYNDWITEWASADIRRLVPQTALPFWNIDQSIAEMGRNIRRGHKGVIMTSDPGFYGLPKLNDPHWDRLWAACQDMGLPVNFHVGSGDWWYFDMNHESIGKHASFASMGALACLDLGKTIAQIICGGICHRFPKLNFVAVESGVGWIPFLLESLDYQWKNCGAPLEHPEMKLLPSEYFKRQFYSSFWFEKQPVRQAIEFMGSSNLLYETDFPHPTCMYPGPATSAQDPKDFMELVFEGVDRKDVEKIVHSNATRLYNLD